MRLTALLVIAFAGLARADVSFPLEPGDVVVGVAGTRAVVARGARLVSIGDGGTPATLLGWPNDAELGEVAVARGIVYAWIQRKGRDTLVGSDAPARPLVSRPSRGRRELAVGSRFACWIEGPAPATGPLPPPPPPRSTVLCQPLAGGAVVVVARLRRQPITLFAHGDFLVWSETQSLFAVDEPGGDVRQIASEPRLDLVHDRHRHLSDDRVPVAQPQVVHVDEDFVTVVSTSLGAWRVGRAGGVPAPVSWMGDAAAHQDASCAYTVVDRVELVCLPRRATSPLSLLRLTPPETISTLFVGERHLVVVSFSTAGGSRRVVLLDH